MLLASECGLYTYLWQHLRNIMDLWRLRNLGLCAKEYTSCTAKGARLPTESRPSKGPHSMFAN